MNTTATRRAIYGKLAGDTTLNSLLGAPPAGYSKSIYYQLAPEGAPAPFVILNRQSGTPTEAFGDPSGYESDVWLIKAVDKNGSADTAESIQARIATLLNDAALSISGATLMYLRRQSDVDYSELTDGVTYRHSGSLYRVVTDPS
jgi:hypothetical protein